MTDTLINNETITREFGWRWNSEVDLNAVRGHIVAYEMILRGEAIGISPAFQRERIDAGTKADFAERVYELELFLAERV